MLSEAEADQNVSSAKHYVPSGQQLKLGSNKTRETKYIMRVVQGKTSIVVFCQITGRVFVAFSKKNTTVKSS